MWRRGSKSKGRTSGSGPGGTGSPRHSFSFGPHQDPRNTQFGLLVLNNDDIVWPRGGFPLHTHREMEIVTWVLDGVLEHRDSTGGRGLIAPGLAQRLSAGTGVTHSEMNPSRDKPVHFIQMWVLPEREGLAPSYELRDVNAALHNGEWFRVASGKRDGAAVRIGQRGATLWAARFIPGRRTALPQGTHTHVFIARGGAILEEAGALKEGDAVRLTEAGALGLTASPRTGAEILVWTMG